MADLKIDPLTNDTALVKGLVETVTGRDEKAQRIRSRLLTVRGEWFLDITFGLDYFGVVWVKSTPPAVLAAHIQREILRGADTGDKITDYTQELNSATRKLTVTAKLVSPNGDTTTVSI